MTDPPPPPRTLGRRFSVVGTTGSGKSTVACALAAHLGVPHIELDAFQHEADWVQAPPAVFAQRVEASTAAESWVMDGNYSAARELAWPAADVVVWLDLPLSTVLRQLTRRTWKRLSTREVLWNGNREQLSAHLGWDGLFLWALRSHRRNRRRYSVVGQTPETAHLTLVRLRGRRAVDAWRASW
ncbi:MAG: adenylate kinase family enzyme [Myxococcota bacterium]|jgi:adenylate kinase family enzyme